MPMAVPTLPGSTHALTTKGPHVVRIVRATPSTAREATSAALEPAASPIHDPVTAMPNAATIMFFAPNRCASNPDGNAANTLASVKIDMSQEAASASMSKSAMRELRMVGTLYSDQTLVWDHGTRYAGSQQHRPNPNGTSIDALLLPTACFPVHADSSLDGSRTR